MNNNKIGLAFVGILAFGLISWAFEAKCERTYLNECSAPVMLNVPFYPGGSILPKRLDIILDPGDLYQSKAGANGHIFEKYGLMPKVSEELMTEKENAVPFLYISFKDETEREIRKLSLAKNATNMPSWWIEQETNKIRKHDSVRKRIVEDLTNDYDGASMANFLFDPTADIDNDSLSNREEMECGSSPFVKNTIVRSPRIVELDPAGCQMVTGVFYINNLRLTNVVCQLDLYPDSIDKKYRPSLCSESKIERRVNKYGGTNIFVELPAKQKTKILYILSAEHLPYEMTSVYDIVLNCEGDFYDFSNIVRFYIRGDHSIKLEKPERLRPESGHRFETVSNVFFAWDGCEKMTNSANISEFIYFPEFYSVESKRNPNGNDVGCILSAVKRKGNDHLVNSSDLEQFLPGNYIWRVVKQSLFTKPVASEWKWFSVGKEIAPSKESKIDFSPTRRRNDGTDCFELQVGVPCQFNICHTNQSVKSPFAKKLPKGLKVVLRDKDRWWRVEGIPQTAGRFTNVWVEYGTRKNICVFSVYNDKNQTLSRSVYDVDKKVVIHDLTVNVPFRYSAKTYYDYFTKGKGPEISDASQLSFSKDLPQGLKSASLNGDYTISGIPEKAGTYDADLLVENNGERKAEKHVFRVADNNEPPLTVWSKKSGRVNNVWNRLKVTHITYPNEWIWYNVGQDFRCINPPEIDKGRMLKETQLSVESIDSLPYGLKLEKESDGYYISGKIENVGVYTNHIRIINTETTYTNTHIYKIIKHRY